MTTDLFYLTLTAGLGVILWIPHVVGAIRKFGFPKAADFRETRDRGLDAFGRRAQRAHANLVENLAPFAILVIVAHVGGAANETTAAAAMVFFWARVAHALIFYAGIPYLRTVAFVVGIAAEVAIFVEIVT
ncbi:MAG: MAPEG family protein [Rhodospirillales bacterium]|jgi:uncharacterized MAPEG superfamily protein|nr:MAPEG family protein [Rhodospirillales bacterium]MDP6772911.1 MAPEG family protein [Rhodospirillales bacterium]